jgi:uncharacterized protein (DUF1684 family)
MASVRRIPAPLWLVLIALAACSQPEVSYEDEMAAWRAEKDAFMRGSAESPVVPEQRGSFAPLAYYPVDPAYRVPAALKLVDSTDILEMPTSTGLKRQMRRIGTLAFTLNGQPLTLTAFMDANERDMRRLFVPFGDLTNATETYNGGRYLDLDRTGSGIYDLDFNRAYFPFCYYNAAYDCPLPPRENRIAVAVKAGEKKDK